MFIFPGIAGIKIVDNQVEVVKNETIDLTGNEGEAEPVEIIDSDDESLDEDNITQDNEVDELVVRTR